MFSSSIIQKVLRGFCKQDVTNQCLRLRLLQHAKHCSSTSESVSDEDVGEAPEQSTPQKDPVPTPFPRDPKHVATKAYGEMERFRSREYEEVFRASVNNPEDFWAEQAEKLTWHKKWDRVLDDANSPFTQWFVGGEMNTCYNCVDRWVERGFGNQVAIIHDSPVTKTMTNISYRQLQQKVARLAGILVKYGVQQGDRVLIYMPMIPEAVISMLACARIGAIHSLVFGGFAARELAVRINHAQPAVVLSANCGIEPGRLVDYKTILDDAVDMCDHKPDKCIILNRPQMEDARLHPGRDVNWDEEMYTARSHDCVPIPSTDPIYILYTSGTTGLPKAVVRPSGGHAVVLNWSMKAIYGINPHEVWWAASDLGWVVGHSYICYAPLLTCNTSVLYEGNAVSTPNAGAMFRVIHEHNIVAALSDPTTLRGLRTADPEFLRGRHHVLNKFRYLFVAGEHCDNETLNWGKWAFGVPVLDNWWQTETAWAITASCVGLKNSLNPPHGVSGMPVPGYNVTVLKKDGTGEAGVDELGHICVKLPLPPGTLSTLWDNDAKFKEIYFSEYPGYYDTMDAGQMDKHGYISVMSRADDVINVAGHRISGGAIEEAILEHDDLAECAVIGVNDELKGTVPIGLLVLKHVEGGMAKPEEQIVEEVVQIVRELIGPVAAFKKAVIIPKLPKTRSGKIARGTLVAMAENKPFKIPVTIEDATVYPAIKDSLQRIGYAQHAFIPEY